MVFAFQNRSSLNGEFVFSFRSILASGWSGWSGFALSNSNTSLENSLSFINYYKNGILQVERVYGKNKTFLSTRTTEANDTIVLRSDFSFVTRLIPAGDLDEVYFSVFLNATLFQNVYYGGNEQKLFLFLLSGLSSPSFPLDISLTNENFVLNINFTIYYFQQIIGFQIWSQFHLSLFIIEISFYFFIFLLLIIFSRKQPLKSRSMIPFVSILAQISAVFAFFPSLISLEFTSIYYCYFQAFLYYSPLQLSYFLIFIQIFRYIIIVNLNIKKNIYISQKVFKDGKEMDVEKVNIFFKILKYMSHPLFNLGFTICFFFIYNLIQIIIIFSVGFTRCSFFETFNFILYITCAIILIIFILILSIYDIFVNRKLFCSIRCFDLFFKKDPLLYRTELYFIGFFLFLFFIITSIIDNVIPPNLIYRIITRSLLIHILFFYQTFFVLIITIYQTIRKCFIRSDSEDNGLIEILEDNVSHQMFLSFAESEFSSENVSCWDDIEIYRKEKDPVKRKEIANIVFDTYLDGYNSKLEVFFSNLFLG